LIVSIVFRFQDVIDEKLDIRQFPSVGGQRNVSNMMPAVR